MRTPTTVSMLLLLAPALSGCEQARPTGGEDPSLGATHSELRTAEAAQLTASDAATDDRFGYSVDVDGDRIVVGTRGVDRAYVYEWDGAGWTEEPLVPDDVSENAAFGWCVAIDGDTAVVGGSESAGAAADPDARGAATHRGGASEGASVLRLLGWTGARRAGDERRNAGAGPCCTRRSCNVGNAI